MNKKWIFLAFSLVQSISVSAVQINNIQELDNLAHFSFSIMGDNNGYSNSSGGGNGNQMTRTEEWIAANSEFCIGLGDHFIGTRLTFQNIMKNDNFWHNNFYPTLGDNDLETPIIAATQVQHKDGVRGNQWDWGRAWPMFKNLNNFFNRSYIDFRQPTNQSVMSYKSRSDKNHANFVPYDDQLVDYYVERQVGNFTVHIMNVYYADHTVLAERSKNFMMSKVHNLAATKTDHDILVVTAHTSRFIQKGVQEGFMTWADADDIMNTADLVVDASSHKYGRWDIHDNRYNNNDAYYVNSGAPVGAGGLEICGYLDVHVFDGAAPFMTIQYINVALNTTRQLTVGQSWVSGSIADPEDTVPVIKYINGQWSDVNWNNLPTDGSVPPPPPPPPPDNPVVSFDTPSGNVVLNEGDDLYVNVIATDNDGIDRVRLYKDGVELGRSEGGAPYEWNGAGQNDPELLNLQEGVFQLTARATDNAGYVGEASIQVTVLGSGTPPPPTNNILQNASFENGSTSWTLGNNASVSNASAQNGGSSLQVVNNSSPTKQTATLQANTDYNFSVWVLASGITAGSLVIDTNDIFDPGRTPGGTGQFVIESNEAPVWTEFNGAFNSADVASVTVRIFGNGSMLGNAYVDNLVIAPVGGNNPPIITSTAVTDAEAGVPYSYTLTAVDPDSDPIVLSSVSIPTWLTFDSGSGSLSGTPTAADVGPNAVSLRASDGQANTDQGFTITVAAAANQAPAWADANVTLGNATEGQFYSFDVSSNASDADNDTLTFSILSSTANWLSISNVGVLSGTPSNGDVGFGAITISVTDGINAAVNAIYSITTDAAPLDPYVSWKVENGVTEDDGDDDGDGIVNIMEYALGGDPNSATSGQKPTVVDSGSTIDFKFKRQTSNVTYKIEKSIDLVNWSDHITVTDAHGTVGSDATVPVSVTEMSNGKLFLRLKIEN